MNTDLSELLSEDWTIAPERFSTLAFLHRGDERILYSTRDSRVLLKYTSKNYKGMSDWDELQRLLEDLSRI